SAYDGGVPVPYAQLYFDSDPDRHVLAYQLLSSFGDDSWTYLWRVLAAEQIMQRYRAQRAGLERLASLQSAAGSAAEVLHRPRPGGRSRSSGGTSAAGRQPPFRRCWTVWRRST